MNAKLPRSAALTFELEAGRVFTLPALSRGQVRWILSRDPDGRAENPTQEDQRRAAQVAIIAEGSALPLGELTGAQEAQIFEAFSAAHAGESRPGKAAPRESLAKRLARFDHDSLALALHLRADLAAAEAVPFLDSLHLLTAIAEERNRELQFQAALHGAKLR